jgi:translation initiation factor IF-1
VAVLGPALFRVELANGHRVLSHAARRDREAVAGLAAGDTVKLELSPFDMSNGRIVVERTKKD